MAAVMAGFGLLLFTSPRAQAVDSIVQWNKTVCDFSAALPKPGLPPFLESRAYAMAHLAMFDALQAVSSPSYSTNPNRSADADAAVAAAARGVLVSELPSGAAIFNAAYTAAIGDIPDSPVKARGIEVGEAAAGVIIAQRASDDPFGRLTTPYTPGTRPGAYQPTPPQFIVLGAGWTKVPTFVLKSNDQFRAPVPYSSLNSLEYTMDVNEIQALGKAASLERTTDQTNIARFWYENSSYAWNRIAQTLSATRGLSRAENARLFAALNCALADAYLASFDSKYYHNFWRPITAIRAGATDTNPLTVADPAWSPLLNTPPIPDYPSGHAAAGGAAAVVIAAFVGGDENPFSCISTTSPTTRTFNRLSDAAAENAYSRMLVGIHFRRACTVGLEQGQAVGKYVLSRPNFLKE